MKKYIFLFLVFILLLICSCCSKQEAEKITFDGDKITTDSSTVSIDGTVATITAAGEYEISGTLAEGQIVVNVTNGKAVYLKLNGIDLTCSTDSPILILSSSLTVIETVEGTQNIITDDHEYSEYLTSTDGSTADTTDTSSDDLFTDSPDAAIYSKCPLLIEGAGKLVINGNSHNGISSSDTLTIEGGNLTINATNHGLKGRDFVVISGGTITIKAGNDGIKATNIDDAALGYINITGGTINVNADDDGVYAPNSITISGGNFTLKSHNIGMKTEGKVNLAGGIIDITTNDDVMIYGTRSISAEAIVTVNGSAYTE